MEKCYTYCLADSYTYYILSTASKSGFNGFNGFNRVNAGIIQPTNIDMT